MKFINRSLFAAVAGVLMLVSCAKEQTESYNKYEDMALKAWITQNRADLVGNYQEYGDAGYYLDVLDAGDPDAAPINDTICWVTFGFSGRDLSGNIILSRDASDAKLAGTFTKYTHYVPFYRYCGDENTSLMEGTYLAMRNKQYLSEVYYEKYKDDASRRLSSRELLLRDGAKVVLYMPSRVVGNGLSGDGGYEGQYTLSQKRPLIVTMEIHNRVKNPLESEGTLVDEFCELPVNGGLQVYTQKADAEIPSIVFPKNIDDPTHPYNISQRWVSVSDSIPQLYVDYRYEPGKKITFPEPYAPGYAPYGGPDKGSATAVLDAINEKIAQALKDRFDAADYKGADIKELKTKDGKLADSVKLDGVAKIWYIGRFLDGFIFDTNIDEVKKIIYGEAKTKGEAFRYVPSEGGMVQAYYYTVPNLKFGQWAAVITTSTNAYGAKGVAGATSTSSSTNSGYSNGYNDYLNYMNYSNSYYGNSYGGYYNNYYGGYGGGYYDPYYGSGYDYNYGYGNSGSSGSTETPSVKTISTEIPPFTPLLFEFYIEPDVD